MNLTSRANIYQYIRDNPGTHFRGICDNLGVSIGLTQYHLKQLVESGVIECEKDSKYKRFFVARKFSDFEKKLLSYLRKPTARKIIVLSFEVGDCGHQELANQIGVSSQAITWQVKQLIRDNIIEAIYRDNSTFYKLSDCAWTVFVPDISNSL